MTIINPNSISGISSITALNSTAAINLFKADGTAANIIAGVTTGANFKTGTSNLHNVGIEIAGINVLGADTPIGAGATIYNSGAAVFTGIVTANNLNVTNDIDVTDDLTIGGEFNMIGSSDSAKYFDARTGASNQLHFRSSLGGASNLVTILSIGRNGSSFVGNLTLGDSSDTSSAAGPEFMLNRNSASPANADYLGQIKFAGRSSTGVQRNYAKITGKILDVTNGAEDGILEFAHIKNGSQVITGRWRSDSLQLLNSTNFSVAGTSDFTGTATFSGDLSIADKIIHTGDTNCFISFPAADQIVFEGGGHERFRINGTTGRYLFGRDITGRAANYNNTSVVPIIQLEDDTEASISVAKFSNSTDSSRIYLQKGRGTTGSASVVQDNDTLGMIVFNGYNGSGFRNAAQILAEVDGTPTSSGDDTDMPGALVFKTSEDGTNVPAERFRIYNDGVVAIGQSSKSSTVGAGNLDIQGNATSCIIEMGNPFPTFSGGVVPEFRITATNSSHTVDFESVWGGDNLLHKHLSFSGGSTRFYRGTTSDEIARFNNTDFGIGTQSPSDKLHVNGGDIIISTATSPNLRLVKADDSTGSNSNRAFFGIASGANNYMNGAAANDLCIVGPDGGRMLFGYGNSVKFRMNSDGKIFSAATYNNTTSSSSRSVVMPNNTGEFFASTSSRKFKTNITTLTDALADKILECRPVSFNSLCSADNKTKTFYGLIAEEVHEIDTSLVAYDDENAETPEPTSVQYDRFVPHLINLVKRQKTQIATLEAKVAALEGA